MIIKGMGPDDNAFVHLTCSGISQSTQAVIFRQIVGGALPRVGATRVIRHNVDGFEHWGTGVSMKDGAEYVFDWWPTLNPKKPLIVGVSPARVTQALRIARL